MAFNTAKTVMGTRANIDTLLNTLVDSLSIKELSAPCFQIIKLSGDSCYAVVLYEVA